MARFLQKGNSECTFQQLLIAPLDAIKVFRGAPDNLPIDSGRIVRHTDTGRAQEPVGLLTSGSGVIRSGTAVDAYRKFHAAANSRYIPRG